MSAEFAGALGAALVAGLFGSLHCIGMCGPIVALGCRSQYARASAWGPWLFAVGKLGSYSVLGLLAGAVGAAFVAAGVLERATAYISIIGGMLMIVVIVLARMKFATGGVSTLSIALARFSMKTGPRAPLFLGIGAALLPCGLLYAMVARSAAAAEPIAGMALMQAFGIGTSPALIGVGAIMRAIPQKWSKFGTLAGEVILVLTGAVLIWRGIMGIMAATTGHSCCH
ncbi:sulfite exporter TauE/SafE family protein [bacterium]|nr:sulfite exporter TauE/SafE family protein [bacterium]MBU1984402.1 sulfite exporter TauE/SafE family protein [bacterium]